MKKSKALKINNKFYYGWVIVCVSALSMFFSAPGQTFFISAFTDSYIELFDISRTTISAIYSVATISASVFLFLMGKLVDRFGQKLMMVLVGVSLAATALFNSFVATIPMIAVGFFLARYLGQGSMSMIPSSLVPQWFQRKRGFAFSLFKFGGTIASTIVPIINIYLITTIGWQMTWRVWALLLLAIFVPIAFVFVINTPEEIGLSPDNIKLDADSLEKEKEEVERESWHVKQAMKTKAFWILGLVSAITPLITTGLGFHFYSIMAEKGVGETNASIIYGALSLPGFFFPLLAGFVMDKVGAKKILAAMLLLEAIGLVIINLSSSKSVLILALLIYGIGMSTQFVASGVMWPNFFGRKYLGSIQGVATVFVVAGSAFGPMPFGFSFDLIGSYTAVIYVMAVIAFVGAVGVYFVHKPNPIKHQ